MEYTLSMTDHRRHPEEYRVRRGEQGVLTVEPYKSEILPHWHFRDPVIARQSAREITRLFYAYKAQEDFVGMDMARKFLQMGFTRSRRYANHPGGRKYDQAGIVLPFVLDPIKARSAEIFKRAWQAVESDSTYHDLKIWWRLAFG